MISQQLKQLRLARGLSLEALAQQMGGIVSKQALSKYEKGQSNPSPVILGKIAKALGVKSADLLRSPDFDVKFIAYRKRARMGKRDQEQLESRLTEVAHQRIRLQQLIGTVNGQDIPVNAFPVKTIDDAEQAAESLRQQWQLGNDPISNLTALLEEHSVHVVELDADEDFDGIAGIAQRDQNETLAAMVVTRRGVPGERQRLSLAHEVGHVVLRPEGDVDVERAAFRFGAALLAPSSTFCEQIGVRRKSIQLEELLSYKRYFGLSIQAILYRMRDLEIISESYFKTWCIDIRQTGLHRREPGELPPERSEWGRRNVLRAVAEGLMSTEEASRMLGEPLDANPTPVLLPRRQLFALSIEERRQLLAEQALLLQDMYGPDLEREQWQGGDILDEAE